MADYILAGRDIKHVLKLYVSSSPLEYYDWDDDMENLLWGRELNSCMQLFFSKTDNFLWCFIMVS